MRQEEEHKTIDTAIITISGAILPAMAILLSLSSPMSAFVRYSLAVSIAASVLTILLTFWNTIRYPKRTRFAEIEIEKILKEMSNETIRFVESVVHPLALKKFDGAHERVTEPDGKTFYRVRSKETVKEELDAVFLNEISRQQPQINYITSAYSHRVADANRRAFTAPLNEPFSRVKLIADLLAFRGRYFTFVVSIMCFAAGLIVWLIGGPP